MLGDILKNDPLTGKPVRGYYQLQRPEVDVYGPDGSVVGKVRSDVPDLFHIVGTLPESLTTQKGATFSFRYRKGQQFPGEPALVWTINGEKGEIRLVSPKTMLIHLGLDAMPPELQVHDFATDKVETVDIVWDDWQKELPSGARNVGMLYEGLADTMQGKPSKYPKYATFEGALARHRQLEELIADWRLDLAALMAPRRRHT